MNKEQYEKVCCGGSLTKRELFAMHVMTTLLADPRMGHQRAARSAVQAADDLILQLQKEVPRGT